METTWTLFISVITSVFHSSLTLDHDTSKYCFAEANTSPVCYYSYNGFYTFQEAELMCSRISSNVILPRRQVENNLVSNLLMAQNELNVWLGTVEVSYKWKDTYQDGVEWVNVGIDDIYKSCVRLSADNSFKWKQSFCLEQHGFICEFSADKCTDRDVIIGSSCYVIHDVRSTWYQAKTQCAEQNGFLLKSISEDRAPLMDELKKRNFDYWIDVSNHVWLDWSGKDLDYFNWADNQPNSKVQICSLMLDDGHWLDRNCSEKHKVICERSCVSGLNGVSSCTGLPDGDYASCVSCEMYASCVNGEMFDQRNCATGGGGKRTLWNDDEKRCDFTSEFCQVDVNITLTTTTSTTNLSSTTQTTTTTTTGKTTTVTSPTTIFDDVTKDSTTVKTIEDISYEFPLIGIAVAIVAVVVLVTMVAIALYCKRASRQRRGKLIKMAPMPDDDIGQETDVDFAHARVYNSEQILTQSAQPQWSWRETYGQPNNTRL